ncbi:hypothetical protein [Desulfonatronum thiodismutans]|uniref:hypothetical protein n=1 Tax=Desulfonatronum thiodismutans TaxID=159290 RepID=UPI001267D04F|nr:hypothetical protein [Desulfonatronum thiodismutans]
MIFESEDMQGSYSAEPERDLNRGNTPILRWHEFTLQRSFFSSHSGERLTPGVCNGVEQAALYEQFKHRIGSMRLGGTSVSDEIAFQNLDF